MDILQAILTFLVCATVAVACFALLIMLFGAIVEPIMERGLEKRRRRRALQWSDKECPRCHLQFGERIVEGATESSFIGSDQALLELRCPHCRRSFSSDDGVQLAETVQIIPCDTLYYATNEQLEAFGSLRVHWDWQMRSTVEMIEERLRRENPGLLERIEFVRE
jgi:hypothetical protein